MIRDARFMMGKSLSRSLIVHPITHLPPHAPYLDVTSHSALLTAQFVS